MNNFGTRPDPDPTPYGEKYPCFCLHRGQLELLVMPNKSEPTSLKWTIVVSDEVMCTSPKIEHREAWKLSQWNAIFPSISWTFYKACGNCKKEPCGGYHQLDNFFLSGDDPVGSSPLAAQKMMDFLGARHTEGSISTKEADALLALTLAALQSKYGNFKNPTEKTCAEVSQWCRE
tara:strand:+ start:1175 stop:1699 length:525 start_codon:yes stop_codon:yes gene_type:complete